jgi:hypothetical protein
MQFYAPLFATFQVASCSKKLVVPGYVVLSQVLLRIVLLVTFTMASCLVYMNHVLDEKDRHCLMSRDMKSTSFYCLN